MMTSTFDIKNSALVGEDRWIIEGCKMLVKCSCTSVVICFFKNKDLKYCDIYQGLEKDPISLMIDFFQ